MTNMEGSGFLSELGSLMAEMSTDLRVYVRHGRFPVGAEDANRAGDMAVQIHRLAADLLRDWERWISGATTPSVPVIEASLEPLPAEAAVALMTQLAVEDLVWPSHHHMDRDKAHRAATRIVEWLGRDASWWANQDEHSWMSVTACTFDGVIVGTDGRHFVILIQVADD